MFRGAVKFRNHFAVSARGSLGNHDHTAALLAGTVDLQVALHCEFIIVPQISMLLTYMLLHPHARKLACMLEDDTPIHRSTVGCNHCGWPFQIKRSREPSWQAPPNPRIGTGPGMIHHGGMTHHGGMVHHGGMTLVAAIRKVHQKK